MGYQIGDRKLPLNVAWTDADGIQRPPNWLRLRSPVIASCWASHGLPASSNYDQRFYWGVDNPKQLNDEAVLDEDGNDTGEVQNWPEDAVEGKAERDCCQLACPF